MSGDAELGTAAVDMADSPPSQSSAPPVTIIEPKRGWAPIDWREAWAYRELLYFLTWRDIKVRYKQTVLGVVWAVLQPVLGMIVFSIIFGKVAEIPSDGFPYPVFVYAGLLPWTFFFNAVTQGGQSLVNQQHLLTKIYLPRIFVPSASIGSGLVDFGIGLVVYVFILIGYGVAPGWGILFLPILILATILTAMGLSYTLAALTVSYRDFRYVIPFMMQSLMWASPTVWPMSKIPEQYRWLAALNPMAGVIDGFRCSILGSPWDLTVIGVSSLSMAVMLVFGLRYFKHVERRFADIA